MVQWLLERLSLQHTIAIAMEETPINFMMMATTIPTIVLTIHCDDTVPSQQSTTIATTNTTNDHLLNHTIITKRTKSWVQRILVDTSICPFTKSITYSGQGLSDVNVPVGKIAYHTSHSLSSFSSSPHPDYDHHVNRIESSTRTTSNNIIFTAICQLQSDVLMAIQDMLLAGPTYSKKQQLNGISSILLAAPGWDEHFDQWTRLVFPILEVSVQVLELTEQVGIVCFHPHYQTPDGRSFPGFGHMHSVPRLQQWLLDHTTPTDMDTAIEHSLSDLRTANVIQSVPMMTMINNDCVDSTTTGTSTTTIGMMNRDSNDYQMAMTAIATAGGAWQRRTPHATINVLRADQLAAAESQRITSKLYSTNILRLNHIGWSQLQQSLDQERSME
jgi:hypothetical protein